MTTIRVARRKHWTVIAQDTVNDDRLSFRARGVLAWLLDKPDDWTVNSTAISHHGTEGRDAVRVALTELEEFGYLVRVVRTDRAGHLITVSTVYECPDCTEEGEVPGRTGDGKPGSGRRSTGDGRPGVGKPGVGKPGALPKTITKHSDQALSSSAHITGVAASDGDEDDQDPQPPEWIGGAR